MSKKLYDVVAVLIKSPSTVRVFDRDRDRKNAEAIISMAIMRRGVEVEFYAKTRCSMYQDGDVWRGNGIDTHG